MIVFKLKESCRAGTKAYNSSSGALSVSLTLTSTPRRLRSSPMPIKMRRREFSGQVPGHDRNKHTHPHHDPPRREEALTL
jgi:hypothetical protein